MAKKKTTAASEETSKAAQTDAARLEARSTARADLRKAQQIEQGEKDRQKNRAEVAKATKTPQPEKMRELAKPR